MTCNNSSIYSILAISKNILQIIQIIIPILLMIFATISFIKLVKNPEEKNGIKKIINQFLAAIIIFFIPVIVNVVMGIVGDNTEFSSCWNSLPNKIDISTEYIPIGNKEKKQIISSPNGYEKGEKKSKEETT